MPIGGLGNLIALPLQNGPSPDYAWRMRIE
jgi:hypothetical protein